MISNQIDFFIPRFHSQRRNSRWPPFTPIAADHAHHRSVGVFMDRFLFLHSRIYIDVFLVFCPTLVFVGFLFLFFGLAVGFSISSVGACLLFVWLWLSFDLYGMFAYFSFDLLLRRAGKVRLLLGNFC